MNLLLKLFLLLLLNYSAAAQSLTATLRNNTVGAEERFEVSFTFSGEEINKLKNFRPPDFTNFILLSGPNYSTSMQIINGAVSASQSYNYILKPREQGKFNIGSASVEYDGKVYKSEPLAINVVKGTTNQKSQTAGEEVDEKQIAENLFVRAVADKNRVYKGEQVVITFKLYNRLSILSVDNVKISEQEGFWTEQLETDPANSRSIELLEGKKYEVYILNKIAVFPNRTGELTITPNEFRIPVLVQKKRQGGGGSLFDQFFDDPFFSRNQAYEYKTKSNKVTITSLPLPGDNTPDGFNGAVGEYTLKSEINKLDTKTNDPVTLKAQLSGTGNIALLDIPKLNLSSGFELYEPKSVDNITRKEKISGSKSIDYLIVPRVSGKKEVPPLEFVYFSPSKKSYVTLKTEPYTINIEQGEGGSLVYTGKENIRMISDDIRFIKMSGSDIRPQSGILIYNPVFWAAAVIPLFILSSLLLIKKRNDRLNSNADLLRYQRAEKIAKNRFKRAKKYLEEKDHINFYSEISQALSGYIEDKFQIPKADFSLQMASEKMMYRGMDEDVVVKMRTCADLCEYYRFAPLKNGVGEMDTMYREMTDVIVQMEKYLQGKSNV